MKDAYALIEEVRVTMRKAYAIRAEALAAIAKVNDPELKLALFTEITPLLEPADWIIRFDIDGYEALFDQMTDHAGRGTVITWQYMLETLDDYLDGWAEGDTDSFLKDIVDPYGFRRELVREITKTQVSGFTYDW
ncbi:hypothetical protein KAMAJI_00540 [Serratia phage vB_SmaM-Kamaji]|nr:hypothetical protein KAMAJI_00540 [Serratia phage vB_SmaM-Kamaji]